MTIQHSFRKSLELRRLQTENHGIIVPIYFSNCIQGSVNNLLEQILGVCDEAGNFKFEVNPRKLIRPNNLRNIPNNTDKYLMSDRISELIYGHREEESLTWKEYLQLGRPRKIMVFGTYSISKAD